MSKYTVYPGEFLCQVCKKLVKTIRLYSKDMYLTWMCEDKHLSEVNLRPKTKKDYEREI